MSLAFPFPFVPTVFPLLETEAEIGVGVDNAEFPWPPAGDISVIRIMGDSVCVGWLWYEVKIR